MILALGLASAAILSGGLVWSILRPADRVWPPQKATAASFAVTWGLTLGVFGGALWLGIDGWGAVAVPIWLRVVGGVLLIPAHLLTWPAVVRFGVGRTSGGGGGLETGGLYRWMRNPQYLGDILLLAGWSLLCAAPMVWPVAALGILALWLSPLAEEPWLRAQYGDDYVAFCAEIPRWRPRLIRS